MERVIVGGPSGVGKTTFARRLAQALDVPHVEMDAMYHGPNWEPIATFEADVQTLLREPAWVIDSHGYSSVRDFMWRAADTAIWLDYSRPVVLRRVLTRSARRAWRAEPIFNGNTETFADWLDPEHPVQWSMSKYNQRREDMRMRFAAPEFRPLRRVQLRSPAAADLWLRVVTESATSPSQI